MKLLRLSLVILPTAALAVGQTLLTGLIGHWTFDEGTGTAVADSSGQGYHGTLVNGGTAWTTGQFGGALYFSGTVGAGSTRVEIPNTPALQGAFTGAITVAAWARVDDIGRDAPILAKEGPAGLTFWFGAFGLNAEGASPGNFGLLLDDGGGQPWTVFDRNQGSVTQGTWVHLASTWAGGQVTHYLNGVPVAGGASFGGTLSATTDIMAIGANAGYISQGNATAFKGAIDDLYVYDRLLTGVEIGQLMAGAAIPEPRAVVLLAAGLALLAGVRRR